MLPVVSFGMRSPLPDSSPLEAGLVADPPSPYRTTTVQDTVRSLLRASMVVGPRRSAKFDGEETIQVFSDVHEERSNIPVARAEQNRTSYIPQLNEEEQVVNDRVSLLQHCRL